MPSMLSDYANNKAMKSKKAEAYMDSKVEEVKDVVKFGAPKFVVRLRNAIYSVELAEQETEERVRNKAIATFCTANCPKGCSFGAGGGIGCAAKYRFIQKMNEE